MTSSARRRATDFPRFPAQTAGLERASRPPSSPRAPCSSRRWLRIQKFRRGSRTKVTPLIHITWMGRINCCAGVRFAHCRAGLAGTSASAERTILRVWTVPGLCMFWRTCCRRSECANTVRSSVRIRTYISGSLTVNILRRSPDVIRTRIFGAIRPYITADAAVE